jgi:hypothetical protein
MAVRISTGLRNALLNSGIDDIFDTNGRINIYSGSQPADADDAATGTLLATITIPSDSAGAGTSGVLTFNAISDATVTTSGTAGWARFYRTGDTAPGSAASASDIRLDVDCGEGSGTFSFDETDLVQNGTVSVSSLTITMPAS